MTDLTTSQRYERNRHVTKVRQCAWDLLHATTVENASLVSAELAKAGAELEKFVESCKTKEAEAKA